MTLNRIKNVVISFYQGVKSSFGWAEHNKNSRRKRKNETVCFAKKYKSAFGID